MTEIPAHIIEYFLLGRTRPDVVERFLQDGGIVPDVWLAFAKEPLAPLRVLVAACEGTSAVDLAFELNRCLRAYRYSPHAANGFAAIVKSASPNVSPLENFVAVTVYLDELLRVLLPLTRWWHVKRLNRIKGKAAYGSYLERMLEQEILLKLGRRPHGPPVTLSAAVRPDGAMTRDWRVIEAAPIAALIGVFAAAVRDPGFVAQSGSAPRSHQDEAPFLDWVGQHAETIAYEAQQEFGQDLIPELQNVQALPGAAPNPVDEEDDFPAPPALIQRVFLDRQARIAQAPAPSEPICTIKADAAERLFEVSCRTMTWAIIDSGIAATHPAFYDWNEIERRKLVIDPRNPPANVPSRVKATFDFTLIDQIRNFDLTVYPKGSTQRKDEIARVVDLLAQLPGRVATPAWRKQARENLAHIAIQLETRLMPDWRLIEPLIRLDPDDGLRLVSDHGTHVAGTLGADWRFNDKVLLKGVCPDINLYDLRVIPGFRPAGAVSTGEEARPGNLAAQPITASPALKTTEFALCAALEFVQFLNTRAGNSGPVVHGVNVSMSIPHDVRNYGCGATPVCLACDRLVGNGTVVVAAAGNRGWNEQEIGFGSFVFCSITDPGNAYDVITVGATHRARPHTYGISFFSSRGPTGDGRIKPDIVAPGEKIRGPIRGGAHQEFDGTSMAAPFVSGAAAILMSRNRELIGNAKRIKQILCDSATDLGRERYFQGHGLLDILRALQSV